MQSKAYKEGIEAYICGIDSKNCPYFFDSELYHEWQAGWLDEWERHTTMNYGE